MFAAAIRRSSSPRTPQVPSARHDGDPPQSYFKSSWAPLVVAEADLGVYYAPHSLSVPQSQSSTTTIHHHYENDSSSRREYSRTAGDSEELRHLRHAVEKVEGKLERLLDRETTRYDVPVIYAEQQHFSPRQRNARLTKLVSPTHTYSLQSRLGELDHELLQLKVRRALVNGMTDEQKLRLVIQNEETVDRDALVDIARRLRRRCDEEHEHLEQQRLDAEAMLRAHYSAVARGEKHRKEVNDMLRFELDDIHRSTERSRQKSRSRSPMPGNLTTTLRNTDDVRDASPRLYKSATKERDVRRHEGFIVTPASPNASRSVRFAESQLEQSAVAVESAAQTANRRRYKQELMNDVLSRPPVSASERSAGVTLDSTVLSKSVL